MNKKFFNIIPSENGEVAILLYGEVGDGQRVDSSRVVAELMTLSNQYKKIDVRINSCGGDVFSGMAIYAALRNSKAEWQTPIHVALCQANASCCQRWRVG